MLEPALTPYVQIGSAAGVRLLVETFYDIVESDPAGAPLMALHNQGHGIAHARDAQFEFLSGFFGGPQLYFEHYRHSNVKRMHTHLAIGLAERDAWLVCMEKALAAIGLSTQLHRTLMVHFRRVAEALVNTV